MLLDYLVAIPECSSRADNDLDACLLGSLRDNFVPFTGIAVGVFLKDEMSDIPGLEEFWKEGLWSFSEDKELRLGVQLGDGLGEVILAVKSASS